MPIVSTQLGKQRASIQMADMRSRLWKWKSLYSYLHNHRPYLKFRPGSHSCGNKKGKREKFPKRKEEKREKRISLDLLCSTVTLSYDKKMSALNSIRTVHDIHKWQVFACLTELGDTVLNSSAKNCYAYKSNIFQLWISNQLPKKNLACVMLCQCKEGNHRVQIEFQTSN